VPPLKQSSMVYLGIDPGMSGGLAVIRGGKVEAVAMPATEKDIWLWLSMSAAPAFAVIEKVQGYIGVGHPGSGMFKFGANYGGLRMALIAAGIPFDEVTPQRWQKVLGISPRKKHNRTIKVVAKKGKRKGRLIDKKVGGETDSQFKGRLRAKAQQIFPSEKVTLATADALLLAHYCRMTQRLQAPLGS
jgi:hypothetical protein